MVDGFPATFRVEFSEGIDATTAQATDLLVNGVAATRVSLQGRALVFELDPSVDVGDGIYTVTMASGAVADLQGTPLATG